MHEGVRDHVKIRHCTFPFVFHVNLQPASGETRDIFKPPEIDNVFALPLAG